MIYHRLQQYGFRPRHQRLDNEASTAFQADLSAKKIDFQLVPHKYSPTECCGTSYPYFQKSLHCWFIQCASYFSYAIMVSTIATSRAHT